MKRFLSGLVIASGVVVLAVGVLAGVEMLLSTPARPRRAKRAPESPAAKPVSEPPREPTRNFSIKRTKSEVGFVYWILEGYGRYKCFILCDTWDEAVAQAKVKMAEVDALAGPYPVVA